MSLTYLDTQIWNYLFSHPNYSEETLAAIRTHLIDCVTDGGMSIVGSLPLLQEVIGTERGAPAKYKMMSELLFRVVGERWLVPLNRRYGLEAASGGVLTEAHRYLSRPTRRELSKISKGTVREIADEAYRQGLRFKGQQEEIRRQLRRALPEIVGAPSAKIGCSIEDWWQQEVNIESWVRGLVGDTIVITALDSSPANSSLSDLLPSAWHFMSFKLARIKRNLGEGRRIAASDYTDAEHYAAGPYVDVLVSDDTEFAETFKLLPACPFKLEKFEDVLARLGV